MHFAGFHYCNFQDWSGFQKFPCCRVSGSYEMGDHASTTVSMRIVSHGASPTMTAFRICKMGGRPTPHAFQRAIWVVSWARVFSSPQFVTFFLRVRVPRVGRAKEVEGVAVSTCGGFSNPALTSFLMFMSFFFSSFFASFFRCSFQRVVAWCIAVSADDSRTSLA